MSCRDGTRSLRARYKPSTPVAVKSDTSSDDGLWSVQPCSTTTCVPPVTTHTTNSDSSRVCGMAIAELTTRHSDSSSRSNYNGSCDNNVFSISTTKSDPRFSSGSSSDNNSSISPTKFGSSDRRKAATSSMGSDRWPLCDGTVQKGRVRVATGWRVARQHHHRCSSTGSSQTLARLLILFVSSILLCHPWHAGAPLLLDGVGAVLLDTNGGDGKGAVQAFGDGLGISLGGSNLEQSIAAVFSRVAYGSTTTTKRSIPDNVYVPSLTTVSTPLLTTFRYREKDKDPIGGPGASGGAGGPGGDKDSHYNHQQISANHRNYELDLERDHVLPTSAPNAEILKSNSNPTYPNPNRHHNHDRHRHSNSTPYPHGHNAKKGFPTNSMFSGDIPAYSPPSRTFFTPPLPRNYTNPFADKPTLRGTNSDSTIINTGTYANRRPLPPPSLMPGHERIPMRPPDLVPGAPGSGVLPGGGPMNGGSLNPQKGGPGGGSDPAYAPGGPPSSQSMEAQRKKALNTPSEKSNKLDAAKNYDSQKPFLLDENANSSAILPNGMHFPSISRILSGSNGRPQMIPDVLLRSVTSAPRPNQPSYELGGNGPTSLSNSKNPAGVGGSPFGGGKPVGVDSGGDRDRDGSTDGDGAGGGGGGGGVDGSNPDGEGRRPYDEDDEEEEDDSFDEGPHSGSTSNAVTTTVSSLHVLSSSSSPITQKMPNLNLKSVMVKNGSGEDGAGTGGTYGNDRNFQGEIADISTWTIAWNIHVYLSAILYTILAVYSIFKIIFYDKLTHLFSQSYFISIHLILIIICLLRIFYLCYDAYNIHFSFNLFTSEVLLNLPLTFLTTTFAILILFLLLRSINHKTNRYSSILRPLTIMIGSGVHVGLCITLHLVESYETQQFYHKQHQLQMQNKQLMMTAGGGGGRGAGHAPPPTNIQIPPRVLSLICQIIYIFICLSLGLLYLYMYRLLKRILHKSQNYIHGYNNLSYAIHITIATALLFILLAALQIYGAISISSQTKVKLSPSHTLHDGSAKKTLWASHIEIDWFQWGYQFSLRFIEIVIIALLSWVTGLKTGPSKVIQREKDMEQPNASGFALFPCTSSSSQENFETDYPAVCNTNRNLHTYTMRTGKPIYDDNFALNSLNLEQNSQQDLQLGGVGGPPGVVGVGGVVGGNDFQRSLETNSMRSSSHNYSNNYNGSNNDHMPEQGDDFLNDTETMPDHYENPNFELKHHNNHPHHHHQQQQQQLSGSGSANQYHDIMDNCYSEPINAPQYDTKSLRGQPGHPMAQHRNYDFQNFERPNFDPTGHPTQQQHGPPGAIPPAAAASISRGEFRASKNLKTLKSGQMQNDLGGGANTMGHHHYNHHNQMGGPVPPGNYGDSFDRRIGVRKSGTLNNIGAMHFNQHVGGGSGRGNNNSNSSASSSASSNNRAALQQQQQQQQQQQRGRGPMSGAQTLSSSRSSNDHHHHHHHHHQAPPPPQPPAGHNFAIPGSFNDRLLNGGGVAGGDSLERNAHPHQQQALSSQDNVSGNNFDEGLPNGPSAYYHSKKRSRESSSSSYNGGGGGPGGAVPYPGNGTNDHQTESSSSPTASIGGSIGTPTTGVLPGKLGAPQQQQQQQQENGSMLVAEQGFVRFRALEEPTLGSRTNLRNPENKGKLFMNS